MRLRFLVLGTFLVFSGYVFSQEGTMASDSIQGKKPDGSIVNFHKNDLKKVKEGSETVILEGKVIEILSSNIQYKDNVEVTYLDKNGGIVKEYIEAVKAVSANRVISVSYDEVVKEGSDKYKKTGKQIEIKYVVAAKNYIEDTKYEFTYDEANKACLKDYSEREDGTDKGKGEAKGGWFLPRKEILKAIAGLYDKEKDKGSVFVESLVYEIPNTSNKSYWYWSSSEYDKSDAWYQVMYEGYQSTLIKVYPYSVRCVRLYNL